MAIEHRYDTIQVRPKVVISLTTHAARNGTLEPTFMSLVGQSIKPDRITLYCAPGAEPGPFRNIDDRTEVSIVYAGVDTGPIMKLSAVLDDLPDDSIIVTADDDIIYHRDWLMTILIGTGAHPDKAIGFSGWNAFSLCDGGGYTFPEIGPVDVLEGWAGAAYRKRFFTPSILNIPPEFRNVDDVWISSQLHKRGIERRTIAYPMAVPTNATPGLHDREDFVELNRQAARIGFGYPR